MPNETVEGGCQCGAIRYRLVTDNPVAYACHCRHCQKQTASAFSVSLPVRMANLTVEGDVASFERGSDSGFTTLCYFCPSCGTRLYHQSERAPGYATLKAGTLDDTGMVNPVAHFWVRRKQPWVRLPDDVPQFDAQPDDLAAWRVELMSGGKRD